MKQIIRKFSAAVFLFFFVVVVQARAASLQDAFEWWRSPSKIQQKVNELENETAEEIPIPVLFIALDDITSDFGTPRRTRSHEGQDIIAPKGTPVVSPTEAVVIHTDYGAGEGNAVYTANPGDETFVYYHLDRIGDGVAAGKTLKTGDLIGYVGNTGDARGGADHLHFEIRDSSGDPIDPYPRFGNEFSLDEIMRHLSEILDEEDDETELSKLLVAHFRNTFDQAETKNVSLPEAIEDAMSSDPIDTTKKTDEDELPVGDLAVGSLGPEVLTLQNYLIDANAGDAASALKNHGATGYFGPLTKAALAEYQKKMDIDSRLGYYDRVTRIFIQNHPPKTIASAEKPDSSDTSEEPDTSDEAEVILADSKSGIPLILNRNLYQGIGGEDVRNLQKFLNAEGYIVSPVGNGSPGNEIPYFGPGTRAAVIKFQVANDIKPSVGYVGPITRSFIASLQKSI